MGRKDLFIEEAVLDDISQGLDIVERPLSWRSFFLLGLVIVGVLVLVVLRVGAMNVVEHGQYATRAYANAGQQTFSQAPRGVIYDRFGQPLVINEPSFSAHLNLSQLLKDLSYEDEVASLAQLLELDASEVLAHIASADLERESYIPLKRDLTLSETIELKKLDIPFLVIQGGYTRKYVDSTVYSHVLGYTGFVSAKDLEHNPDLTLNDEVGKAGLEGFYDSLLRGKKGSLLSFQDALGNVVGTKRIAEPQSGDALHTGIDGEMQEYVFERLSAQLTSLNRHAGVAVVMNASDGALRSLVSIPSYDNNTLTSDMFVDKRRPLFNRAVSGLYSPGSTIKPVVGVAALAEHIIDPLKSIFSAGYIEIPNPYNPSTPSRFVDWKPHGWVNLYSALARSSNVYFYEVGGGFEQQQGLGIENLHKYWELFGLGEKVGIDLLGDTEGMLPTPEWKERVKNDFWRVGDTYNVSIGQGDLLVTPLALVRAIAAIANRGELVTPHVVEYVTDADDQLVSEYHSNPERINVSEEYFSTVEKGMIDGVVQPYGTAHLLSSIPLTLAAKTGSAQVSGNTKTNAFFIGYSIPQSDADGEQIVVLILIEDAKEGSLNAVPVARDIFEWYYEHRVEKND
jgi:penicillin-binding protein 2